MIVINKKTFTEIEKKYPGDTVVLLGNGPSLTGDVIQKIFASNYPVFCVNRFYRILPKLNRGPDFFAISDASVLEKETMTSLESTAFKFCPSRFDSYFESNWIRVNHLSRGSLGYKRAFSTQAETVTYGGYTVIFFALQIIFRCHFNRVLLHGCDLNYDTSVYNDANSSTANGDGVIYTGNKTNHFIKDYFKQGEQITRVYTSEALHSLQMAGEAFAIANRELVYMGNNPMIRLKKDQLNNWF